MPLEESLHDVTVRERQLEAHILRSAEYLHRADQELKRQVTMLYLAIALLLVIQGLFTLHAVHGMSLDCAALITVTSFLAIANCLLLIRTKTWLHRLNEAWLAPHEKEAFDALKIQRHTILANGPRSGDMARNAELN